jgi:hypothetical protein
MAIPPLSTTDDLPVGIHPATLTEVLDRFGRETAQRIAVGKRLERSYRIASATGLLRRFLVFGSFVTGKPNPNDVDVFLIMEDTFDGSRLTGEALLLFDHTTAQSHFGVSLFFFRQLACLNGEQEALEYWQIKRGGGERGVVEIIPEAV